jgi:hypothetical protein
MPPKKEIDSSKPQKVTYRIGIIAIAVLLTSAAIADLITLIPLAGDIVAPIYWAIAAIYFWSAGLGLINWRRLVPICIALVAKLIPAIQEFPETIAGVIAIIIISRFEDKTGKSVFKVLDAKAKTDALNAKGKRVPPRIQPLNDNEARLPQN